MCVLCWDLIRSKESRRSCNLNNPNCIIFPVGLFGLSNTQCATLPWHCEVCSFWSLILSVIIRLLLCPFLAHGDLQAEGKISQSYAYECRNDRWGWVSSFSQRNEVHFLSEERKLRGCLCFLSLISFEQDYVMVSILCRFYKAYACQICKFSSLEALQNPVSVLQI